MGGKKTKMQARPISELRKLMSAKALAESERIYKELRRKLGRKKTADMIEIAEGVVFRDGPKGRSAQPASTLRTEATRGAARVRSKRSEPAGASSRMAVVDDARDTRGHSQEVRARRKGSKK